MDQLDRIMEEIARSDDKIIAALAQRMGCVQDIIACKKKTAAPILQPGQDKTQEALLQGKLADHPFRDEILDVFACILKNSKKIQASSLFSRNIMLIGFMGTGKTTISAYLNELLGLEVVEMDALIVEKEGMSIRQIFQTYGEEYFRGCESRTLVELQKHSRLVVSCGGGVVLRDENIRHMKKGGRVVLLSASPETIFGRVKNSDERPILNGNMNVSFIAGLLEDRRARYELAADITICTDNKSVQEICEELVEKVTAMD